jgi:MFS family permease
MPDPMPDRIARRRNFVLVASLLFMVIGTGSIYFLVVALKLISAEFDWPRTIPSVAYSLQYFGAGIGGIFMGYILDRLGMAIPALVGASMIGGGALLTAFISNEWQLYFIYGIMMGLLGRSALFSPLTANITRWFEHNRSMAVGIVGSGQALAGAIWPPIFQHFFSTIGWRETSFWYGVFALATMLPLGLVLRMKPPSAAAGATPPPSPKLTQAPGAVGQAKQALSPKRMQVTLSIASVGCCVAMSLPLAHLVSHVSDIGYDPARGAEILSLMLASAAAASFFGVGFLSGRFGGLGALLVFSAAQGAFLITLAFVSDLTALYVIGALFGLGYGGILPCYPIIVREYLPASEAGRRTGLVILCAGSGMALGAWFGGVSFDLTGSYKLAFMFGAWFNVANLLIIGSLYVRSRLQAAHA